ncbi:MAG: thioesterase superfamily protein [Planctomycetaceae bacterium]|nr:thioesterase superfamily protein [Planctomycetaceae bacterium]
MSQFVYHRRVQFSETDMAGIVHFSNYYRYMEEAEHAFLRSLGLSVMMTRDDGSVIGWPRVRTSCAYEAPARFEDEIEIRLNVSRKGVKSLTLDMEFWRGETRLARGSLKTVCCIVAHNTELISIPIPPDIDAKIVESPELSDDLA